MNHIIERRLAQYFQSDFSQELLFSQGTFNIPATYNKQAYLRKIGYNLDEIGNKVSVQGELIFLPASNTTKCLLTMTVDHTDSIDSAEKTITINGKAIGLHNNLEGILELDTLPAETDVAVGDGLLDHIKNGVNAFSYK